jgi:hypothetical protein
MANSLDLVTVQVPHIGTIIVIVILGPGTGSALVRRAFSERGGVEGIDRRPIRRQEGHMGTITGTGGLAIKRGKHPKLRTVLSAVAREVLALGEAFNSQGRENGVLERAGPCYVVGTDRHMTEHCVRLV